MRCNGAHTRPMVERYYLDSTANDSLGFITNLADPRHFRCCIKVLNSQMRLIPIDIDDNKNDIFRHDAECADVLNVYPMYYQMVGYSLPWIGYFATIDGKQIVGAGGFKGRPMQNKVEIAYTIFKQYEGKGLGAALCKTLVLLAKKTDPGVIVTARTLMEENASVKLLRRNGFLFKGVVNDKDDGDVWEWEYPDL